MKLPQLYLRDLFWLVLVGSLCLSACKGNRDLAPKHDGLIGVDYHYCPKCHSLSGGIYGKGPNLRLDGPDKASCVHAWESVSRDRFKELATEHHGFDWTKERGQFWQEPYQGE